MPIKTLHLTNCWHERSGGIATFYRALMQAAERKGQPMRLVVPGPADIAYDVGGCCRIYEVAAPFAILNNGYRTIDPRSYLRPLGVIRQILAKERPDVVEVCDKYTLNYLAALLRMSLLGDLDFRPAVIGLTCERMDDNLSAYLAGEVRFRVPDGWRKGFPRFYMRHLYFPFFDHHIAVSRYTADELRNASERHPICRGIWVRPMGVDCDTFTPARRSQARRQQLRQSLRAAQGCSLLVYAGRLAAEKNLALLVAMMAALQKGGGAYRLVVAGDGPARSHLELNAANTAPGRITFLGHIADRQRLADLLANCDAFVHANASEPFGIAPLEAMASGLPAVLPDSGGVKTYADPSNCILANPDPLSFAEAVRRVCADRELAGALARNGRATAQRFSWVTVAESYLNLYRTLNDVVRGYIPLQEAKPQFRSTSATQAGRWVTRVLADAASVCFWAYERMSRGRVDGCGLRQTRAGGDRPLLESDEHQVC